MRIRLLFAGAILLNIGTLAALVYVLTVNPEPAEPADKPESAIAPVKIRQLDRKQIPNLAMSAGVQQTALKESAVCVDSMIG